MTKPPDVDIHWFDAHSPEATAVYNVKDLEKLKAPFPIITRGWLLYEDDLLVIVASEDCGDGDYRGLTCVPKAMVKEIKRKARKPRTPKPRLLPAVPSLESIG